MLVFSESVRTRIDFIFLTNSPQYLTLFFSLSIQSSRDLSPPLPPGAKNNACQKPSLSQFHLQTQPELEHQTWQACYKRHTTPSNAKSPSLPPPPVAAKAASGSKTTTTTPVCIQNRRSPRSGLHAIATGAARPSLDVHVRAFPCVSPA